MVGMYAEEPPRGFGFSDTAFRVFILMASRRLEERPLLHHDYRPEVYTRAGLDWVEDNRCGRCCCAISRSSRPRCEGVANPFAPWRRAGAAKS